jgi:pimeloyl-ACP methyl ester carboxylesterase
MSIPIFEVQIDKNANLVIPSQQQDIVNALTAPGNTFTDVVVMSHGWNNDIDEARTLYRNFFGALEQVSPAAAGKTLAVGILWPSKKFVEADLIPGGAASADNDPVADAVLLQRLEEMKHLFGDSEADEKLEQMKALVAGLSKDANKQNQFVSLMGAILDQHTDPTQRSEDEGKATISGCAQNNGGAKVLQSFGLPITQKVTPGGGGAASVGGFAGNPALHPGGAGAAAGLGDFFSGIKAGALRLLNFATYNVMKDRAGKIGRDAVNPLLQGIQAAVPQTLKFHLVGHSFGGRLVTATVDGPNALRVQTLLLLQAAYSHNGLALTFNPKEPTKSGFFHAVFDNHKVTGPILITHSKNDRAVGLAYPLASRLNQDDAAEFGGADDLFGGMGANGAQHVDKTDTPLLPVGGNYDFTTSGKRVFNLNGDEIIQSHGDVARPETAAVLAAAMKL